MEKKHIRLECWKNRGGIWAFLAVGFVFYYTYTAKRIRKAEEKALIAAEKNGTAAKKAQQALEGGQKDPAGVWEGHELLGAGRQFW